MRDLCKKPEGLPPSEAEIRHQRQSLSGVCREPGRTQHGFSLLSVLLLSAVVATVFMAVANYEKEADEINRARTSGWHLLQIAKAARLYVRNNSVADPSGAAVAVGDLNGDGIDDATYAYPITFGDGVSTILPQEISVATLVNAGLLPQGFKSTNALKQTVKIVVANYPLLGDPLDPGTVTSAYVFLLDNDQSNPRLMQYVADVAKENGFPVSAPTFNASGTPIDDCEGDGQTDVILWDSGCISLAQMNSLAAAAGGILPSPFPAAGSLGVPAWRSMPHDTRAVMRYRQAENPEAASMATNINFGHEMTDATGNCVRQVDSLLPNGTGGYTSSGTGLCDTEPDNAAAVTQREQDRRVDIDGLSSFEVSRLVLSDQTMDNPGTIEVSYMTDASGTHVRNADGDTAANGRKNPLMAPGTPEETLGVVGGFSTDRILHVGAESGTVVGPAAYFADSAGTGLGAVVVESNLILSDGDPATSENLSINGPVGFKNVTTNTVSAGGVLSAPGGVQANTVSIASTGMSTVNTLSAGTVSVPTSNSQDLSLYNSLNSTNMSVAFLGTTYINTQGTVTVQNASVTHLIPTTLSLGNASLFGLTGNKPDITVDMLYHVLPGCPYPPTIPPTPGC